MTAPRPFECVWLGGVLTPVPRYHNVVAGQFGEGEVVTLERHEERSWKSHGHYFAVVNEAYSNLPYDLQARWATPDHMRKWALIKAGIHDERSIVTASKAEAQRLAAFMRPLDEYAVILASEAVVTVYTAKSQSVKAMGKAAFQESKDKVLAILADLIGVTPEALSSAGKQAA